MTRHLTTPEVAEALMGRPCETCDGRSRVEAEAWDLNDPDNHLGWVSCLTCDGSGVLRLDWLVVDGEIEFEPWRSCTVQCEAHGRCAVCDRWYPPAGRSTPLEMYGSYCEHECDGWDDEARRSHHLWPGEFERLDRQPPADIVRAIETGERIDIVTRTACPCPECGRATAEDYNPDVWHGCDYCEDDPCIGFAECVEMVVGNVQPVEVLPIVHKWHDLTGPTPCIDVEVDSVIWRKALTFEESDRGDDDSEIVDWSVHGDPTLLVGKFAVRVTDPRKAT